MEACDEGTWGEECMNTCNCLENTLCDVETGCTHCVVGWSGTGCSVDINECDSEDLYDCPSDHVCSNIDGSYECVCPAGTRLTENNCVGECRKGYRIT